jgi:hypothetical protein
MLRRNKRDERNKKINTVGRKSEMQIILKTMVLEFILFFGTLSIDLLQ